LTDVVMPEMNGRDLAVQLHEISPQLRCLYMSGYTADVIACHGVLEEALAFIQKPFTPEELAAKVRAILDQDLPVDPPRSSLVPALAPN
jgi:two-component system, cell cycle sensor histidine kinase and response regulator CckA